MRYVIIHVDVVDACSVLCFQDGDNGDEQLQQLNRSAKARLDCHGFSSCLIIGGNNAYTCIYDIYMYYIYIYYIYIYIYI